jgi:hypothetical protein
MLPMPSRDVSITSTVEYDTLMQHITKRVRPGHTHRDINSTRATVPQKRYHTVTEQPKQLRLVLHSRVAVDSREELHERFHTHEQRKEHVLNLRTR